RRQLSYPVARLPESLNRAALKPSETDSEQRGDEGEVRGLPRVARPGGGERRGGVRAPSLPPLHLLLAAPLPLPRRTRRRDDQPRHHQGRRREDREQARVLLRRREERLPRVFEEGAALHKH